VDVGISDRIDLQFARRRRHSKIDKTLQTRLINLVLNSSARSADPRDLSYGFWMAKSLRHLEIESAPEYYRQFRISQVEYLFRHSPQTTWSWSSCTEAELIRELIAPFAEIFAHMTRVKIHLQKIGERVAPHRDLSAGQVYSLVDRCSTALGPNSLPYQMYPWVRLEDFPYANRANAEIAYSLKIPLSVDLESYGRQSIFDRGLQLYTTDGDLYLLNENNLHGSEAVPYVRGLVFIDGIINLERAGEFFPDPVDKLVIS
jgi:hypothetical protein